MNSLFHLSVVHCTLQHVGSGNHRKVLSSRWSVDRARGCDTHSARTVPGIEDRAAAGRHPYRARRMEFLLSTRDLDSIECNHIPHPLDGEAEVEPVIEKGCLTYGS